MRDVLSAPYRLEYTYTRSTGPVVGCFLNGLKREILLGAKTRDGRVLCPPTEYDENGEPTSSELVELPASGTVKTWSWVEEPRAQHPLKKPFAWALIQIDGAHTSMLHAVDAPNAASVRTGMRVGVRWAQEKTGSIRDIGCFEPIEDAREQELEIASEKKLGARAQTITCADSDSFVMLAPMRLDYQVYPGEHQSAYLRALERGKILGGRCRDTNKVYVPPRAASPLSGNPIDDYVEVADAGTLTTFTVVRIPFEGQKLKPPYCFGAILLDGADLPIYHLISGVPYEQVRMGMRVRAKWKPKEEWGPTLENILYFEPTGEPDVAFEKYKEHL